MTHPMVAVLVEQCRQRCIRHKDVNIQLNVIISIHAFVGFHYKKNEGGKIRAYEDTLSCSSVDMDCLQLPGRVNARRQGRREV